MLITRERHLLQAKSHCQATVLILMSVMDLHRKRYSTAILLLAGENVLSLISADDLFVLLVLVNI